MSDPDPATLHDATSGGVAATHAARPDLAVLAAPATAAGFNTVRSAVFPIACFRLEDVRFDFGSSVILPDAAEEMPLLADLLAQHATPPTDRAAKPVPPPATVFGHADPVGDDEFNKKLSGRRAAAVYGLLTRRAEVWEDLYADGGQFASTAPGDVWGVRSIQIYLNAVLAPDPNADAAATDQPDSPADDDPSADPLDALDPTMDHGSPGGGGDDPPPFAPLAVTNEMDDATRDAVRQFQGGPIGQRDGLGVDGDTGPQTRKSLFLAYMDRVCVDGDGRPFRLDPTAGFLGHGADAAGKADYQGCGEFNPAMVFSQSEASAFESSTDKTARNAENGPNRRVVVLLFTPGATVSVDRWPCPRATEGTGGCRKRLWSDGEARRSPTADRRFFDRTADTFACRFYQRMVTASPCERALTGDPVPLHLQLHDPFFEPCRDMEFIVTGDGGFFRRGLTDGDGRATVLVPSSAAQVTVRYRAPSTDVEYRVTANVVPPEASDDPTHLAHLRNFGFGQSSDPAAATLLKFQAADGTLDLTGVLDDPTRAAIDNLLAGELKPGLGVDRG